MHTRHQHLYTTALKALMPTQMTVGLEEVGEKSRQWAQLGKRQRKDFLDGHWFPAVRGPGHAFYIVDHHHLGRALFDAGVKACRVVLLKDLATLDEDEFWVVMEHHQWVHPYDARGRRRSVKDLPDSLAKMADDPYRSLAGAVRRAGGFPKDSTPFAEFLWADFFRRRLKPGRLQRDWPAAVAQALTLCHSPAAAHLPGWSGTDMLSTPE